MSRTTVSLDSLPQAFGDFEHPEVAEGRTMRVTALSIDEHHRRVRLDLTASAQRRVLSKR